MKNRVFLFLVLVSISSVSVFAKEAVTEEGSGKGVVSKLVSPVKGFYKNHEGGTYFVAGVAVMAALVRFCPWMHDVVCGNEQEESRTLELEWNTND